MNDQFSVSFFENLNENSNKTGIYSHHLRSDKLTYQITIQYISLSKIGYWRKN